MKNNYIVNKKQVLDIKQVKSNYSKSGYVQYFILSDMTEIKARGTKIKIQCHKCEKWKEFTYDGRYEIKEYICTSCRVSGKNNPFYGKKHSKELKDRLSKERKGVWGVGEKNAMHGKPCYFNMSEDEKQQWKNNVSKGTSGKNNPMYGKKLKDCMTPEKYQLWKENVSNAHLYFSDEKKKEISNKISAAAKLRKEKDPIAYSRSKAKGGLATKSKAWNYEKTKPEIKLEQWLISKNIDYDYSCIMGSKEKCFQYDFILHNKRILIEVQGNYWHGNPKFYNEDGSDGKKKLNDIQKQKIVVDQVKAAFAKEKNFKLICVWEDEINNNDYSKIEREI